MSAGPRYRGMGKEEAYEKARSWITRVGLARFEKHYPHQLSGGMRKRVALAQTFINEPKILLMDEPFSALDVQTRTLMQGELLDLWQQSGASVIFVTHDLEEAIALADKVYVLTAGQPRSRASTISTSHARASWKTSATTASLWISPRSSGTICARKCRSARSARWQTETNRRK